MIKNDYRRSLILLRPHAQGYSGHVRLERRTLIGTMYAVINAPMTGGDLCAVLVRRDAQDTYFAVRLGELRRDSRGQATLAYSFDPRNIDGKTLEDYQLFAIVEKRFENCDVVLSGNVNGSQELNWNSVRAAACAVCACVGGPAGDICPPRPQPVPPAQPGEGPSGLPTPSLPGNFPAQPGPGPEGLPTPEVSIPTPIVPGPEDPENTVGFPEDFPTPELPTQEEPFLPTPSLPAEDVVPAMAAVNARDVLGADLSAPWPGVSEQLRSLFRTEPAQELMLGDDHVYIRASMPAESGYSHVEIGVQMENGVPVSVAYALPSRFSPEPPPGLEDYEWKGGASEGWWVVYTDPETGAPFA